MSVLPATTAPPAAAGAEHHAAATCAGFGTPAEHAQTGALNLTLPIPYGRHATTERRLSPTRFIRRHAAVVPALGLASAADKRYSLGLIPIMERLDSSRSKEYGPLVIWANDLVELFSELKDCKDLEFVADDVKFDSIEEFIQECRGRKLSEVKIKVREPYLTSDLYPSWAKLYVSSSQLLASGLFLKVDSILSRCERKPRFFFSWAWPACSAWVIPNLFYLTPLKPLAHLQVWAFVLTFAWMFFVGYIHLWKFSTVYPVRQEDRPGFIKRNRDGIVIAVISALLGAVMGAAATKLADRIWPNSPNIAVERDASPQSGSRPSP